MTNESLPSNDTERPGPSGNEALPLRPGDEAPEGTPGTGEDVCPRCGGSGQVNSVLCPVCVGTGRITRGIGGA